MAKSKSVRACFVLTAIGAEEAARKEVEDRLGVEGKSEAPGVVTFPCSEREVVNFLYHAQCAINGGVLLGKHKGDALEWMSTLGPTIEPFVKGENVRVRCYREGMHGFTSADIELALGKSVVVVGGKTTYKSPSRIICVCIVEDHAFVGVGIADDLTKREYKVYAHKRSLKGAVAFAAVQELPSQGVIVDPFCKDGMLLIEGIVQDKNIAVHKHEKKKFLVPAEWEVDLQKMDAEKEKARSWVGFDTQMKSVNATKKNAKLAEVHKDLAISRMEVEWLETKYKEGEVAAIVTQPPESSKTTIDNIVVKLQRELFHQAAWVLEKKGRMILVTIKPEEFKPLGDEFKLRLAKEVKVQQGKEEKTLLVFEKV